MLGGRDDAASVLPASSGIEEDKQDTVGGDADEIVKVARDSLTVVDGRQIASMDFRNVRMHRVTDGSTRRFSGFEESTHCNQAVNLTQNSAIK
jgi:hypothetical protein